MLASLSLALSPLAAAPAPTPQSGDVVTSLLQVGDTLDTAVGSRIVWNLFDPVVGLDGGWVTTARLGGNRYVLVGRRAGSPPDTIEILREPGTVGGVTQSSLAHGALAGGQLAYLASTATSTITNTAWLDDQLLARTEDPVPGTSDVWGRFTWISVSPSGHVLIGGQARPAGAFGPSRDVLVDWTNQALLLESGELVPGAPSAIVDVDWGATVTSNGGRWAALVSIGNGTERAIVVDGAVHEFAPGSRAFEGAPCPPSVTAALPGASWVSFDRPSLSLVGDVVVSGDVSDGQSAGGLVTVRNASLVDGPGAPRVVAVGVGRWGEVLQVGLVDGLLRVGSTPVFDADPGIDVDGDGAADAPWRLSPGVPSYGGVSSERTTVFRARIESSATNGRTALLVARPYRVDTVLCDGVPNSTGWPASIVATGSSVAADDELTLEVQRLPAQTFGLPLASRTTGFVMQPGNSLGVLCLGGSIGRLSPQVFTSGELDNAPVRLDLTAVAQPTGPVSVSAGETWHFQAWYRDSVGGVPRSNFSTAVSVTFD